MKKIIENFQKMFHIISVIKRSSKPYFYLVIISNLLSSITPFINIIFTNLLIDGLISGATWSKLYPYVLWLTLLNLGLGIILRLISHYQEYHATKLQYNLDQLIALKTFELDYGQIENLEVMKLIQRAQEGSNSSGGIVSYGNNILGSFLRSLFTLINALIILSALFIQQDISTTNEFVKMLNHPLSGIFLLIILAIVVYFNTILVNKDNAKSYEAMMGNIDGNRKFSYFFQLCANYKYGKDIRIYGMQDMIIDAMGDAKYSVDNNWRNYSNYNIKLHTIIITLSKILAFAAYLYVGLKAYYDLISIGNVVTYASAITLFASAINNLIQMYAEMSLRNSYLDNYFTFLNLKSQNTFGDRELQGEVEAIEFKDLSFSYPNQTELILKDINLTINKGEKLAIVGPNGAGKTTLIKLLCRLYEPTKGEILINKLPISEYSQDACYQLFSIVFQDFALFSYSVKDNVASGIDGDEQRVWDCLNKAGIKKRVEAMDKQLDTILYQRNKEAGVEISGGEAQKLAIARALYKDAPIVILDEPTAALDPQSEAEIYEKFHHLVQDKTAIFISHRMSSCKFCDSIIVIDQGKIIQKGTHQELLKDEQGLYYQMWHAQASYYQ